MDSTVVGYSSLASQERQEPLLSGQFRLQQHSDEPQGFLDSFRRQWFGTGSAERQADAIASKFRMPEKVNAKQFGPKVFFSSERTFLSWLNISVTISSISALVLSFASQNRFSQVFGIMLLTISVCFCCYSLYMYYRRSKTLRGRSSKMVAFDDRIGPIVLAIMLGVVISLAFVLTLIDIIS